MHFINKRNVPSQTFAYVKTFLPGRFVESGQ